MTELTKYRCEYCRTEYKSKCECAECEKNHKTRASITSKRYIPYKNDRCGYPIEINVAFEGGITIKYKRADRCS